ALERLIDVLDDGVRVFDADRQAYEGGRDAGGRRVGNRVRAIKRHAGEKCSASKRPRERETQKTHSLRNVALVQDGECVRHPAALNTNMIKSIIFVDLSVRVVKCPALR